ncbi:phosphatidylinositol-specific phospholipase C [Microdochium trichocladiopsis]|uniref:Phosphoinositide phospholipase C n=1 Tax=Microdochium trichocladiopsis TaxID=1682393 RepID=A0A9P8Y1G4_9PEZI|nr:phosphatidylinositol-specific phospholipase C [Microdochium trichocladiopsis]KAH7026736.1 phosphatidylinositol-specific phospholipase C [Microdochium trichocladiopsis]
MADAITARLARLNPLSKRRGDDDDVGEAIDDSTVAGGGHGARHSNVTDTQLRVSSALRAFLVKQNVLSEADAQPGQTSLSPALRSLLERPHAIVPPELTDRSHPLPEYFISSSHNTYLMGHQLHGKSSATAYETALNTGSRCVEVDAWDDDDNTDEPKVTHGYTLVSHIPFRAVCETIRDVVDREAAEPASARGYRAAPIVISLENHCGPHGQLRLAQIMSEVLGDRLLSKPVREQGHREQEGTGDHVSLDQLGSKVVVIVEYHFPGEVDDSSSSDDDSSSSSSDDEEERVARKNYKQKKQAAPSTIIIPELAELGVYAQSVKPRDNSWYEEILKDGPHHHLINVSETGLASHLPAASEKIARHNAKHLMRVFPKGTRISSKNLKPTPFWGVGAQICAMNWQTFGASMQLNEALFSGTDGYLLKPAALRAGYAPVGGEATKRMKKLRVLVAGATDVPVPPGHADEADEIRPYVTCTLIHPSDIKGDSPPKRKTSAYKQHRLKLLHKDDENPPVTDPIWNETLEWEYDDGDAGKELVFLRILIKSDVSFATNPIFAVAAIRLLYAVPGWSFIRMLDLKGHETTCSLLVKIEIEDL